MTRRGADPIRPIAAAELERVAALVGLHAGSSVACAWVEAFRCALAKWRDKLNPPRHFALHDCAEIVALLGLQARPAAGAAAVVDIEFMLFHIREDRAKNNAEWLLEAKRLGLKAPRGTPRGPFYGLCSDVLTVAHIYQDVTGEPIRNSVAHPFFRLAQICTRRADPSKYIQAITKPPFKLRKPGEKSEIDQWRHSKEMKDKTRRLVNGMAAKIFARDPDSE